jgi:hypothetical protein
LLWIYKSYGCKGVKIYIPTELGEKPVLPVPPPGKRAENVYKSRA